MDTSNDLTGLPEELQEAVRAVRNVASTASSAFFDQLAKSQDLFDLAGVTARVEQYIENDLLTSFSKGTNAQPWRQYQRQRPLITHLVIAWRTTQEELAAFLGGGLESIRLLESLVVLAKHQSLEEAKVSLEQAGRARRRNPRPGVKRNDLSPSLVHDVLDSIALQSLPAELLNWAGDRSHELLWHFGTKHLLNATFVQTLLQVVPQATFAQAIAALSDRTASSASLSRRDQSTVTQIKIQSWLSEVARLRDPPSSTHLPTYKMPPSDPLDTERHTTTPPQSDQCAHAGRSSKYTGETMEMKDTGSKLSAKHIKTVAHSVEVAPANTGVEHANRRSPVPDEHAKLLIGLQMRREHGRQPSNHNQDIGQAELQMARSDDKEHTHHESCVTDDIDVGILADATESYDNEPISNVNIERINGNGGYHTASISGGNEKDVALHTTGGMEEGQQDEQMQNNASYISLDKNVNTDRRRRGSIELGRGQDAPDLEDLDSEKSFSAAASVRSDFSSHGNGFLPGDDESCRFSLGPPFGEASTSTLQHERARTATRRELHAAEHASILLAQRLTRQASPDLGETVPDNRKMEIGIASASRDRGSVKSTLMYSPVQQVRDRSQSEDDISPSPKRVKLRHASSTVTLPFSLPGKIIPDSPTHKSSFQRLVSPQSQTLPPLSNKQGINSSMHFPTPPASDVSTAGAKNADLPRSTDRGRFALSAALNAPIAKMSESPALSTTTQSKQEPRNDNLHDKQITHQSVSTAAQGESNTVTRGVIFLDEEDDSLKSSASGQPTADRILDHPDGIAASYRNVQGDQWLKASTIIDVLALFIPESATLIDPGFTAHAPISTQPFMHKGARLVLPLHHKDAAHWSAAMIDKSKLTINHYNPLPTLNNLSNFEDGLLRLARPLTDPQDEQRWSYADVPGPLQPNTYDCGVYSIIFCLCMTFDIPMPTKIDGLVCREICRLLLDHHYHALVEQRGQASRLGKDLEVGHERTDISAIISSLGTNFNHLLNMSDLHHLIQELETYRSQSILENEMYDLFRTFSQKIVTLLHHEIHHNTEKINEMRENDLITQDLVARMPPARRSAHKKLVDKESAETKIKIKQLQKQNNHKRHRLAVLSRLNSSIQVLQDKAVGLAKDALDCLKAINLKLEEEAKSARRRIAEDGEILKRISAIQALNLTLE